jgi:hypothetical protein
MKNIDLNVNGQHVVLNIRDYFVTISTLFSFTGAARCGIVTIKYTVRRGWLVARYIYGLPTRRVTFNADSNVYVSKL